MNNKKILWSAFILIALAQLYVPAKMIWNKEDIMESGKDFKFKTAPVDPSDPFRGKYITLRFDEDKVSVKDKEQWSRNEVIYVSIKTDSDGFVKTIYGSKETPTNGQDFLKAKVGYVSRDSLNQIAIEYPFDRFYMEETKAKDAETTYRNTQLDSTKITYALVGIKNGEAVLKDVLIDGVSIAEIVEIEELEN